MSKQNPPYRIPSEKHSIEYIVENSRFIASAGPAQTVDAARTMLHDIRAQMPDASHHVYSFRVGYGSSVIEGMSDDGEPSGTAGPPVLAVLRGSGIGDIALVVTRYFGGTKLGTGGLVRAYSESARRVLETLPTEYKIARKTLGIVVTYSQYGSVKRLIEQHHGVILDESFTTDASLIARFAVDDIPPFSQTLQDSTAGTGEIIELESE